MARKSDDSNSLSAYYDHHPTLILERPVALIGFPGVEYPRVGHDLASLTGLPLIELDRWIEHQAGQSLWALLQERGPVFLRDMEARLLEKALAAQPCGLIILGDGTLIDRSSLEKVQEKAALVYFRVPLVSAYWELRRQLEERPPGPSPFLPRPLDHIDLLRPLFAERRPGFESAHMTIDMEAQQPEDAVPLLVEALPRLARAWVKELEDLDEE